MISRSVIIIEEFSLAYQLCCCRVLSNRRKKYLRCLRCWDQCTNRRSVYAEPQYNPLKHFATYLPLSLYLIGVHRILRSIWVLCLMCGQQPSNQTILRACQRGNQDHQTTVDCRLLVRSRELNRLAYWQRLVSQAETQLRSYFHPTNIPGCCIFLFLRQKLASSELQLIGRLHIFRQLCSSQYWDYLFPKWPIREVSYEGQLQQRYPCFYIYWPMFSNRQSIQFQKLGMYTRVSFEHLCWVDAYLEQPRSHNLCIDRSDSLGPPETFC